jgi:hypothetical protein
LAKTPEMDDAVQFHGLRHATRPVDATEARQQRCYNEPRIVADRR